jgi:hypothetical protein
MTMTTVPPTCWGSWTFDRVALYLEHDSQAYGFSLGEATSPAVVLNWIMQVQTKVWATPPVMGDLVTALADLLTPQATLCSFGRSLTISRRQLPELLRNNERLTLVYREARDRRNRWADTALYVYSAADVVRWQQEAHDDLVAQGRMP